MEGAVLGCSSGVDKQTSGDILAACAAPPFCPSFNCVILDFHHLSIPTLQLTSFNINTIISRTNQSSIVRILVVRCSLWPAYTPEAEHTSSLKQSCYFVSLG
ncbi:uncharacterized protein APUU_11573S [Aspergillus puulaauensis]|uniref:Uncharacterized protein n=1 Tax=Aspergillus puulaauensis TaxID=1220207 RepID=A0A7R8AIJ3_9EURO|nr:uncharacterized protein APUU_11573S [Aspergillus puulaauensis]BCS18745.1 hypothetical protein APUU_11573S [Aspergillus puulaauensis]